MIWYLIEDYNGDIDYKGSRILSLTPEASYLMGKQKLLYDIIENFYDVADLKKEEDEYFIEQLSWIRKIDRLFKEICGDNAVAVAHAHFYQLKCFIDSLIIQARILNIFFQSAMPEQIIYVYDKKQQIDDLGIYDIFNNKRKFLLPLVAAISKQKGIPLFLKIDEPALCKSDLRQLLKKEIKKLLKKFHMKSVFYFFKYLKIKKYFNSRDRECSLNILLLHAGCIAMDIVTKELITRGHKVFLKTDNEIALISNTFQKNVLNLDKLDGRESMLREIKERCYKVYKRFVSEKDSFGWINDKCAFDTKGILNPYFEDFITNVCARNLIEMPLLEDFINKENIDFVVARSSSEKESVSAVLAAGKTRKRVCFQHGCSALDPKAFHISELDLSDYYFAMHDEAQKYMEFNLSHDYVSECTVLQAPYQMKAVEKKWRNHKRDKNLIMYIPTKVFFGFQSYNENLYPITWYFEFQKALIDLFTKRNDFTFIYKYAQGQEWSLRSILIYIKGKNISNIHIEKRSTSQCLDRIGRVVLDYPSTSLYEVASAGLPVMSLCHEAFDLRELPCKLFGKSIQKFRDISGAVKIVNNFIDDDPKSYIVNIPMSNNDAIDVLKKIKIENICRGKGRLKC